MIALVRHIAALAHSRRAVTALEYGLIAAVIGGVVITAATTFGNSLSDAYSTIGNALTAKAGGV